LIRVDVESVARLCNNASTLSTAEKKNPGAEILRGSQGGVGMHTPINKHTGEVSI
jgi:hypothetical protein